MQQETQPDTSETGYDGARRTVSAVDERQAVPFSRIHLRVHSVSFSAAIFITFVRMYHDSYRSPVTIWYQACKYPIIHISWCLLHYDDSRSSKETTAIAENFLAGGKFTTRLCEFFAIDRSEDFLIWNL